MYPDPCGDCEGKQCEEMCPSSPVTNLFAAVGISVAIIVLATIILITGVVIVCKCRSRNKDLERHQLLSQESVCDHEERVRSR